MRWAVLLLVGFAGSAAAAETISGKVIAVPNGDTLLIVDAAGKRHRIALADVDAPERRQAFGPQARQSLIELCLKKAAEATAGHVTCDGVAVNAEQVRRGWAWVSPKQTQPGSPLFELEAHARLRQLGLWAGDKPVAPWEWRATRAKP
jgi:endonuclease YncB( thermonuclease family)